MAEADAVTLFGLMEKFAGYGFNKSHAAAYALIAYQTAYLKTHYPAEFMAACMSSDMDDTDKVNVFYEDCKLNGIVILPPDINESGYYFVPVDHKTIRYGLGAVKGRGGSYLGYRSGQGAGKYIHWFVRFLPACRPAYCQSSYY